MVEPAFRGAGQAEGMELWRIENLAPVKIPEVTGKFYTGDSYILLKTYRKGTSLAWNIHFWLGAESSQDETGVAAYKSVELDDSLGGGPVQYREVQGNESDAFLTYFKNTGGVQYLEGGVDSGFTHVERDVYETRLLHVKGKRTIRVKEVPVSTASLNTGDVFILDLGLKIFIWNGPEANKYEKVKGLEVGNNIRNDERGGRAELIYVDDDPDCEEFWTTLGGKITVTDKGEDDEAVDAAAAQVQKKLTKLVDHVFAEEIPLVNGRFDRKALDSNHVYLIQSQKCFIWIGKQSKGDEKKEAMVSACKAIKEAGLPANTAIIRVSEGVESSAFKGEFFQWEPPISFKQAGLGHGAKVEQVDIDYAALSHRKAQEDAPIDDGSGKIEVFRVEDFKLEKVAESTYGQFYGGDSYVIHYSYEKNGRPADIIYFWQGRTSSTDEKGSSALLTKEMDDKLGGRASQVRVPQGKEPSHFRTLFKGKMIIHEGGRASGFSNSTETDSYDTDGVGLFHIKGTTDLNTFAVQVEEKASSLNSADCFVLMTPTSAFAWNGRGSNEDEKAVCLATANRLAEDYQGAGGRAVVAVEEGSEPEEFWTTLGGKTDYLEMPAGEDQPQDPRLFWASTETGAFRVEEIDDFAQDDLIDDDVMILDTYTQVFIWVGSGATAEEKREAQVAAVKYIDAADDGRSSSEIPFIEVRSGEEPIMFTNQFHGWDNHLAERQKFADPYAAKLKEIEETKKKEVVPRRMSELKHVEAPKETPTTTEPAEAVPASPYENVLKRNSIGGGDSGASAASSDAAPPPVPPPVPAAERRPSKFAVPVSAAERSKSMVQAKVEVAQPSTSLFADPASSPSIPYEELKGAFPSTVDPAKKEEYLSDEEFSKLFGVSKDDFRKQAAWKRNNKKKELGLF